MIQACTVGAIPVCCLASGEFTINEKICRHSYWHTKAHKVPKVDSEMRLDLHRMCAPRWTIRHSLSHGAASV